MQAILSSPGPIIIVTPGRNRKDISAALRLCHTLHVYHRLDAEIITEDTALQWNTLGAWPSGNIIFIGTPSSPFTKEVLQWKKTAIRVIDSIPTVGTRNFNKAGQGSPRRAHLMYELMLLSCTSSALLTSPPHEKSV